MATSTKNFETFGSKLFSTLSQESKGENVFLSPVSLAIAMSMCSVGARHETLKQMLKVFELSSKDDLIASAEHIMQVFAAANGNRPSISKSSIDVPSPELAFPAPPQITPLKLKLVNCLYVQKGYEIQQKYLDLIKTSFRSAIDLEDFEKESDFVVEKINGWVERQTRKRIQNILSTNEVNKDTRIIIVNCIYFKGEWVDKFQETNTDKHADFHHANGKISKFELMFQKEQFNYRDDKNLRAQIAHLPYKNADPEKTFVFTIVLPQKGVELNDVEKKLASNSKLKDEVLNFHNATSTELSLHLPKFKLETKYELGDVMISLGMKDAFDDKKANFKGIIGSITDDNRIAITKIIHKTFLNVNEEGTEAAAAGAVIMTRFGSSFFEKPQPIEFKVNRPFLFYIQEVQHKVVLFSGKYVSPPATQN